MINTRYRVEELLGTGGTGLVYKAFDEFERRTVAVKRLAAEKLVSKKDRDRAQALFEREYHVLAELAHPKIIQVYDYGLDDEGPYYTMEWLQGRSLRSRAPLSFVEACRLVRDIASSLAIVHSRRLVHRDVTPHNIYCSDDGHAKLIDFGAMTPFGVPKIVVGTPPFMAPECVHFQPVDGRTDLFSLGACLYYALTGRHAFPARTIAELPDAWRTRLAWPSQLAPGVPEALDRLVLELLSSSPAGRPGSAAEVFERLTTIADLDAGEHPTVARAYLASPALSGRRKALGRILRRTLRATRGRGSAITIAGPAGMGRSRLFDAAVLEAKLSGFVVLRGDTTEGRSAPFAGVRSMTRALGEVDADAARSLAASVANAEGEGQKRDVTVKEAARILRQASTRRSVAVCVDDVHLLDDESVAVLALLASSAGALRLLVLTTLDSGADRPRDPALALLLSSSARVELEPLTSPETRSLLSSLFGEVPNLDTVSSLLSERARGNARELLDAAQSLVDGGLARYAGGAWTLPNDPAVIRNALVDSQDVARRVQGLSAEAQRLLAVLSLDRDGIMDLHDYADLVFDGNRAAVNRALSELLQWELVRLAEDRCLFARDEYRTAVAGSLPEAERKRLHGLLGTRAESIGANAIYPAFHYFHAGKPAEAGAALNRFRDALEARPGAAIVRQPIVLETAELIAGCQEHYSDAFRAEHGAGVVINAVYQGLPERAAPHAPRVLERLSFLTALTDYHARTDLEPGERLGMVFSLAAARCEDASAPGFNPVSAVRRLCQLSITTAVCARFMADPDLLRQIPDLSPFAPLSPAVALAARLVTAIGMLVRGREWEAWDAIDELHADLNGPMGEGIDELTRLALRSTVLGQLCALESEYGSESTLSHLAEFAPIMPDLAESCRARYYLARGMPAEAASARRQFELLSAQSHGLQETRIIELPSYLALQAASDDVLGLKRTLAAIALVEKTRPRWKARAALAAAHVARCRGEYTKGLSILEASLEKMPDDHAAWAPSAALRITLLDLAGVPGSAVEAGMAYLSTARARRVPIVGIGLSLAAAHARVGDSDAAERLFEELRALLEGRGVSGIVLGRCYEVGAHIASLRGDRTAFQERADACARHYRHGENTTLTARYDALLRADQRSRTQGDDALDYATVVVGRRRALEAGTSRDGSASSSVSGDVHADVLALLVERAGARGGFLYTWTDGTWSRVFGTPGLEAPNGLDAAVVECVAHRTEASTQTVGATTVDRGPEPQWTFTCDGVGRLVPCLLEDDAARDHLVGVAVLAVETDADVDIPTTSLAAAARALAPHQHASV